MTRNPTPPARRLERVLEDLDRRRATGRRVHARHVEPDPSRVEPSRQKEHLGELPKLLDRMEPGVGLVNGYKLERHDPAHRVWIGNVYNFCARFLFRIRIRDIDCDYRLIRRALLDKIQLISTSGTICVELVRKLEISGCRVVEVGVHHYPRIHGRSQFFRIRSLARTFLELLSLWVRLVVLR